MQRLLMLRPVVVLIFAGFSGAIAQKSSVKTVPLAATQSVGAAPERAQITPQRIESDKAVVIIATGIAPRALASDPRANIYLTNAAAANRVFTLTGIADVTVNAAPNPAATARLALVAGSGASGSLGDGGGALAAQFSLKLDSLVMRSGIAVAGDGTIFVADTLNSTIRRIAGSDSAEPGVVRSIAGRWASKHTVAVAEPLGAVLDRAGNLYIADGAAGAIDVFPRATDSSTGDQEVQPLAQVASPASMALTVDGRKAFVASLDTGAVSEFDTQTRVIQLVAAFPLQKSSKNSEVVSVCARPGAEASPAAVCPAGLAVDGGGNLFVAEANSGRILRLDAKTSQLTTAATGLHSPGDMSFDSGGNLYLAEQGANRIVKFVSMGQDPPNLTITMPAALPPPPAPRVCPSGPTGAFNFCGQPTGGSTATQAFTLTNNTSAAVNGLTISFTGTDAGDFQAPSSTCGTSLAAGASCAINVDFAPTATGSRSAALSIADAAGDSATASVTGTGDDYQLVLNGSPMEQSVVQGGTLKFNFNIKPDAVFGGDVMIVCPSNIPSLSTCTPSASTVTVTPGTPAQFSLTFETTYNGVLGGFPTNGFVPRLIVNRERKTPSGPPPVVWLLAALATSFTVIAFVRGRLRTRAIARRFPAHARWMGALLLTCALAALGLGGCKHHSVPANLNTPPGVTNLIVQGTAQNAGRGITIILDVVPPG